jgi:Dolichyl-phosphate-mannose-protein mannosyltransferase/PA14 domain
MSAAPVPGKARPGAAGWKLWALSLAVPLVFFAVGLSTLEDYAETWDEQFDLDIGRFYCNEWKTSGFEGLTRRFIPLQRNYGPFFDVVIVATHDLLHDKLKWIADSQSAYHFPVLLICVLGLWLLFWFGYRLFGAPRAILATLVLATMPQFIGHSQNNLKDPALMVFFMLALFVLYEAIERRAWLFVPGGVALGLTYAIKLHAFFVVPILVLWQAAARGLDFRRWRRTILGLTAAAATAFVTVLVAWPAYRHAPLARFWETYQTFRHHWYDELVFYLGEHYKAHGVPWHFPFVMLGVNTPLVPLLFAMLGLGLAVWSVFRRREERSALLLLTIWLFVPLLIQIASGSIKLDGVRHYLLVLPAMALLAAHAMWASWKALQDLGSRGRVLSRAYAAALAAAFAVIVWKDVAIHPYQVVFFNRLAGGIRGAHERFELDYWGTSFREATRWMNTHLPQGSRVWLTDPALHFFHVDRSRLHIVPDMRRKPNYKINLIRGLTKIYDTEDDYLHPRRKPVYAVSVDGADLLQVFEYEENRDLPDGAALRPVAGVLSNTAPGLETQEFADLDFQRPQGSPGVWEALAFDCTKSPYTDRAVAVRASGSLRVDVPDVYTFEVLSDDDAFLYLNDALAIGNGSGVTSRRRFRLERGVYRLRLDYRNDIGGACLRVQWGRGEDPTLAVLAAPALARGPVP